MTPWAFGHLRMVANRVVCTRLLSAPPSRLGATGPQEGPDRTTHGDVTDEANVACASVENQESVKCPRLPGRRSCGIRDRKLS